ncbi:MAG: MBL fold metallo-hydrolase [Clostridia bacterium]|nr:MBL fold metallo-hydrolase [Clostridia bacterium]
MKIVTLCTDSFGANTHLLISGNEALVVDPAVSVSAVLEVIRAEDAFPVGILLTHGHFDHVVSLDTLRDASGIEAYIHESDAEMLTDGKKNAFSTFFGKDRVWRPAERLLSDGDTIPLGDEKITVIHTPGHTQGSVCYMAGDALITGDTIFAESFGRCDLWSGDIEQMRKSLRLLRTLPSGMTIYPGHGASSRLGHALDNVAYLL